MLKINWTKVSKAWKIFATIVTTILGTIAVQSCSPEWFQIY